jgi:uncharacterized protein (DUF3820 family)
MLPDPSLLIDLVKIKMPFGKYKECIIADLPISYLEWFKKKGFPKGRTGQLLESCYEIKLNGLDYILKELKAKLVSNCA